MLSAECRMRACGVRQEQDKQEAAVADTEARAKHLLQGSVHELADARAWPADATARRKLYVCLCRLQVYASLQLCAVTRSSVAFTWMTCSSPGMWLPCCFRTCTRMCSCSCVPFMPPPPQVPSAFPCGASRRWRLGYHVCDAGRRVHGGQRAVWHSPDHLGPVKRAAQPIPLVHKLAPHTTS